MPFDRRTFLHRAAALIPAMHAFPSFADPPSDSATARFERLTLRTAIDLEKMATFYRETLRLRTSITEGLLRVSAGATVIEFRKVEPREGRTDPYYHFAFNIPHNQLDMARAWLEPRCPLVKLGNGEVIANFQNWDAHAFYFLDPAGNILEFIARHTLKNDAAGEFNENNILCASEIGVVTSDVVAAADAIGLAAACDRYRPGNENVTAMGDEHGLFIVVKICRRWFSSDREAEVFDAEAHVRRGAASLESTVIQPGCFVLSRAK